MNYHITKKKMVNKKSSQFINHIFLVSQVAVEIMKDHILILKQDRKRVGII